MQLILILPYILVFVAGKYILENILNRIDLNNFYLFFKEIRAGLKKNSSITDLLKCRCTRCRCVCKCVATLNIVTLQCLTLAQILHVGFKPVQLKSSKTGLSENQLKSTIWIEAFLKVCQIIIN